MEKSEVPLGLAYKLLNPGSVTMISVGSSERDNIFSVTWNMPARKDPPKAAILSGKRHFSYPFIAESGEFGINIPDASLADAVLGCGTVSGSEVKDKFARFGLSRKEARRIGAPLVDEAVANLECRVCQVVDLGASSLLIADIVFAHASKRYFTDGMWNFDSGLKLLHHLSGSSFCTSEAKLVAKNL